MSTKLIRISDAQHSHLFNVATEEAALDKYAVELGCADYASLANGVYEKSVEQAKDKLRIETVTLREALAEIIDDALESDVKEDGAEDPFELATDWADWCWQGKTGDDARAFAKEHNLNLDDVYDCVRDALRERELDDINAPFEGQEEVDQYDLAAAFSEVEDGLDGVDDTARADWRRETALEDAHEYVHAYICDEEGNQWAEAATRGTAFREALDAKARDYILRAIEGRDALNVPTIDDAITAWKRATTQADRDLAEEAIGQHIAQKTPEGGDYEAATDELIARLKAEFGPVPTEDLRLL